MKARSLSLKAYRALARRAPRHELDTSTPRPTGELVWIHLGSTVDLSATLDLAERLSHLRPECTVLVTLPIASADHWQTAEVSGDILLRSAPDEHPRSVAAFLDHWRPDLALWIWGGLLPNLVDETARRRIPLHLISADTSGFDGRRDRWMPELARNLMTCFDSATARNNAAAQRLNRLGMRSDAIRVQQRLRESGRVLPCDESDIDEMSAQLGGRPVWLATQSRESEWDQVLTAHKMALRSAHRLLLILEPHPTADLAELRALLSKSDLSCGYWGNGEWPDESMQVLVADIPDELGLWYRVATVSFLGSSLQTGLGGTDPMPAAALGTAILYGPNVRKYLPRYTRLAKAGAARIVNDSTSLGAAVSHLIAPDNAASMAHAGWDVSSEGAEVIDSVLDLVQEELDAAMSTL